jgi:hypothetical protein
MTNNSKRYFYVNDEESWFDMGTVVELVNDLPEWEAGIFRGYRNGLIDEEMCPYDEFVEMSEQDCLKGIINITQYVIDQNNELRYNPLEVDEGWEPPK